MYKRNGGSDGERDEDKGGEALPVTSLNQQLLSSGEDTPALLKHNATDMLSHTHAHTHTISSC